MNINLRDTGNEIKLACSRVLALSSATLVGSLIVSGAVVVAGEFPGFKAPHRVARMSVILMGASAAGCILGAWMTGGIGKKEDAPREVKLLAKAEKAERAPILELHQKLEAALEEIEEWEDWWENAQYLGAEYNILSCKGCRFFDGSDNGGNFFVCAMHPYGQRNCEDKE